MPSGAVVLEGVTKTFPQGGIEVQALRDLCLSIPDDVAVVSVFGPSGSGKTTLLNLLGALDRPSAGRVLVDGEDVAVLGGRALTEYRRRTVGFVFQTFNLIPNLSAFENVAVPMEFAHVPWRRRRERTLELLAAVDMRHRAAHRANKLSGGEQQRVGIARALANDPRIILADEPTANLDRDTGARIVALLVGLARTDGKRVIIATHDPAVSAASELNIELRDGSVNNEVAGAAAAAPDDGPTNGNEAETEVPQW